MCEGGGIQADIDDVAADNRDDFHTAYSFQSIFSEISKNSVSYLVHPIAFVYEFLTTNRLQVSCNSLLYQRLF